MTALTAEPRHPGARWVDRPAAFRVELVRDWKQAIARCNDVRSLTLFQDPRWLDAWYKAFTHVAHVEPLIAVISDALTSERVALLPLVRRLQNGIRIIEFADLELTDYNAPMLGPAAPRDARGARALWRDLLVALRRMPGGADFIRLRKMPADLDGSPNPLTLLDGAMPSPLNGNVVVTGEDFDANWSEAGACSGAILPRRSRLSAIGAMRCASLRPWKFSRVRGWSISD